MVLAILSSCSFERMPACVQEYMEQKKRCLSQKETRRYWDMPYHGYENDYIQRNMLGRMNCSNVSEFMCLYLSRDMNYMSSFAFSCVSCDPLMLLKAVLL